ncbi:ABC transporter ATP-binding protein [Desulfonatronum thioautotrophicum]|uniref:ABC transporter ATP-binding protein n=1 Tax=Desulfonatronum thioautotrophicum TaxID=617001 RepID=UPI000A7D4957|nr:ABC transporter ATP-binding protein [Desulfonatronum thioautotrophicum]
MHAQPLIACGTAGSVTPAELQGQNVQLRDVTMAFGDFLAVNRVDLEIRAGEFFSFLGPSGCGKTTLLRLISGFNEPTSGDVLIGGRNMRGIGPNRRPTALIFQNLALFPLMKVWENVAFGLEARGVARGVRRKRSDELLELVALTGEEDKLVSQLSGGQRQRVAIARALAVNPSVLLLDEPLSALDLKLRQHMRAELRAIQRRTGVTFIYITHDQGEAFTMSDRVAVMQNGMIEQVSDSALLYDQPATPFVATFVGENNPFFGTVAEVRDHYSVVDTPQGRLTGRNLRGLRVGQPAVIFVRPERCHLVNGRVPENVLSGRLCRVDFEGAYVHLFLDTGAERNTILHMTNDGTQAGLNIGSDIRFGFTTDAAVALSAGMHAT